MARKSRTWKGARTPSALKRARQALRRRTVNRRTRSEAKTLVQQAAGVATAAGVAAAGVWEMAEWVGLKLGARGMDLSYDDTMEDMIETSAGALLGGLITLLRHPTRLRRVPGRAGDPIVERKA